MGRLCWRWAFVSLCPRGYIGIMKNKMETTKKGYIGTIRDIKGLYWDNGKENKRAGHGIAMVMGNGPREKSFLSFC